MGEREGQAVLARRAGAVGWAVPQGAQTFGFAPDFPSYTAPEAPEIPQAPQANVRIQQYFVQINNTQFQGHQQEEPTKEILRILWDVVETHEHRIFALAGWVQAGAPMLAKHEGWEGPITLMAETLANIQNTVANWGGA